MSSHFIGNFGKLRQFTGVCRHVNCQMRAANKTISAILAIAALSMSSSVSAAAWCQGYVNNILTYDTGDVAIWGTWRSAWTTICNVKTEWKGVPPEICFTWFSTATSSITENKATVVYYRTLNQADCATMPLAEAAPAPGYVRLIK